MILEGIGIALGVIGAATSFFGSQDANEASQAAIAAQQRQEAIRKQAMDVDADRRRRQAIREMLIARSTAVARGAAQGAGQSGSSALPGAFGQIAGRAGFTLEGINTNQYLGNDMFSATQQLFEAKKDLADAQSTMQLGSSLSSLGGGLLGSAGTFDRVFSSGFGSNTPALGLTGPSWFGNNGRSLYS
jgi:hypothetical protein